MRPKHKYSRFEGKKNIFPFALAMLAASGALAGPARAEQADILRGPDTSTCDSPDYVAGVDASGQSVAPADTGEGLAPALRGSVQPEISVRLRNSHGASILVNADNVLNPPPACASH